MKDWKASIRYWERNETRQKAEKKPLVYENSEQLVKTAYQKLLEDMKADGYEMED